MQHWGLLDQRNFRHEICGHEVYSKGSKTLNGKEPTCTGKICVVLDMIPFFFFEKMRSQNSGRRKLNHTRVGYGGMSPMPGGGRSK